MNSVAVVDTDVVSYLFRDAPEAEWYRPHLQGRRLVVCFVTVGELYFGALKRNWGQERVAEMKQCLRNFIVYPFEEALCLKWAEVRVEGQGQGQNITHADAWIAATALLHHIPLITNNAKHFTWVRGLEVISATA